MSFLFVRMTIKKMSRPGKNEKTWTLLYSSDRNPFWGGNLCIPFKPQVAKTRPVDWIQPSTLFYPAGHLVSTRQQCRAPCPELRSSYIYTVLKLRLALWRQLWGWCGLWWKWVWHPCFKHCQYDRHSRPHTHSHAHFEDHEPHLSTVFSTACLPISWYSRHGLLYSFHVPRSH